MAFALGEPHAGIVCCSAQGFGAVLTDVSDEGTCTTCGSKLQKNDLGPTDRMQMRSAIMRVAALRSARQVNNCPRHKMITQVYPSQANSVAVIDETVTGVKM